jgi:hypothetical protein
MPDRLGVDFSHVVDPAVLFPAAHLQPADDDDPLALLDAAADVSGQLAVALDGEPRRLAVLSPVFVWLSGPPDDTSYQVGDV